MSDITKLIIDFDKDKNTIFIKDSNNHFGTVEIYGITTTPLEELKKLISFSVNTIVEYYKELCDSLDEAN